MASTVAFLADAARHAPDTPFAIGEDEVLTFAEVDEQAGRFAVAVRSWGVAPGDPVALMLPNAPAMVVAVYGTLRAGAVPVMLSLAAPGPEVSAALRAVGAVALVADAGCAEAAHAGAEAAPSCRHVHVGALDVVLSRVEGEVEPPSVAPDDPALILFTSGTTGTPKGAVVTHANVAYFADLFARDFWRVGPGDVLLMLAPNAHIIGQCVLHTACAAHAGLRLMQGFEPGAFLRAIEHDRVTFFAGVPSLGRFLLASPALDTADLSSLRTVMLGGAPVGPELVEALEARLGARVLPGYGMTEAAPIAYVSLDEPAPPGSVGRAAPQTRLRVVDEAGDDVPTGERGEVLVRGPQVFGGYHGDPEGGWFDGWLRTGDVGVLDNDGFLTLVDRLKHLIKTGGYAVYAAEVERVLDAHPAVAEAAVVGRPHPKVGEVVHAFVALRDDVPTADLIRHCRQHLASYKAPRVVTCLDALPRSRSGKVDRAALAATAP